MTLSPCGIDSSCNDDDFLLLEDGGLQLLLPAEQQDALVPLALVVRRGALKALLPPCGIQHGTDAATREAGVWLVSG